MKKINFVTSFNETILKNIGHHFLNSINEQWEPKLPLTCYHHDCKIDSYSLPNNSISYRDLSTLENYKTFKENNSQHNGTEGGQIPYNIKLDSLKWCHKVFALTEHAFELAEKDADAGWLIWIDADSYAQKRCIKNVTR